MCRCCERVTTTLGEETVTDGDVDVSVVCACAVSESPQLLGRKPLQTVALTCPWCVQVLEQLCERVITAQKDGAVTDGDVHVSVGHFLRSLYPEYLERMAGDQEVKAAMIK